ncbi:MAG: TPM domain-containing protein [Candidatus Moraniibacteriota bacterium]|jgi:uncharacterized membrane protein YgcG
MKKWLVLIGILLCFMPQVLYADECSSVVWDQAGVFGSDKSRIADVVQKFEEKFGATVRMQAIQDFGGHSSFDTYVQHLKDTCSEWQSTSNGKLISLIVSFGKRDLGLYYGDFWKAELDLYHKQIRENKVKPLLRSGDLAQAFITALNEIEKVLDVPVPAAHVPQSNVVRETMRVAPPTVVVQKEATDMSGLWSLLKWIFTLSVVGGIIATIIWFFRNKKREQEKRSAAQRKAQSMKVQCSRLINELKLPIARSKSLVNSLVKVVVADDIVVVAELFASAEKTYGHAARTYTGLPSKMDPDTENLSVPEYVTIAKTYGEILASLIEVNAKNILIAKQVADLKQRVSEAPKRISAVKQILVEAVVKITHVEESGYFVLPMLARMENANDIFNQAQAALEGHRYNDVFTFCDSAEDEAEIASSNAVNLPELHEAILDQIVSTEESLKKTHEIIAAGKEIFFSVSKEYLASAWMPIRGNGTEAENAVIDAMQLVQQAKQFVTMNEQNWEQAQSLVNQSNLLIAKAQSLVHSITELSNNLDIAKANVHKEIRDAQADIEKTDEYISMYDADIDDGWWNDLTKARENLEMAKVILQDVKPDYVRAMRLAISANKSADHILDQAENERETMVRKRRRLATARITAEQSLSVAEEYLQDHRSDISSRARNKISNARERFDNAKNFTNISEAITRIQSVSNMVDSALDIAQSDVSDAQSSISGGSSTWGTSIGSIGGSSSGSWSGSGISGGSSGSWGSSSGGISGGSSGGW